MNNNELFCFFVRLFFGSEMNDENIVDMSKDPDRLDQILTDYQRVHEAATNEIDRKRRAVRTKCEERVWMAALWRDYQLEIVKKSFENEIRQIEREHQVRFKMMMRMFYNIDALFWGVF